ncbi:MAG: TspO/MBR family protein [Acidobacteriota bacterium]
MTETSEGRTGYSTDRLRAILVLIATFGTIGFNFMSAAGYINGVTPEVISDRYPTIVTPAGYAFTIWSVIYLGLVVFSIYQLLPSQIERFRAIRSLYIVSCLLNCVWIYFWHAEAIAVCFVVIFGLWLTLMLIVSRLRDYRGIAETWILHAPFGIYFAWVTAATLVNFAVMLVFLGKMPTGNAGVWLGGSLLLVSAATAVFVRIRYLNFFFPLAIAWAATAIAVKNSSLTWIVVAAAAAVVVGLVTTGSIVTTLKDSTSE